MSARGRFLPAVEDQTIFATKACRWFV